MNGGGVDVGQYGGSCTHVIVDNIAYVSSIRFALSLTLSLALILKGDRTICCVCRTILCVYIGVELRIED